MIPFQPHFLLDVPCDSPHKSDFMEFRNLKFEINKRENVYNLSLWPIMKWNIGNISGIPSQRVKGSEIGTRAD